MMKAPQIIVIVIYALSIGVNIAKHGQRRQGEYNAWGSVAGAAIMMTILWWGGFFG